MKTKLETITVYYKIVRETSIYNKYIKWFAKCYRKDKSLLSSFGYRTEKEARESIIIKENPFPIGERLINFKYEGVKQ